jgi:hypothetical protein
MVNFKSTINSNTQKLRASIAKYALLYTLIGAGVYYGLLKLRTMYGYFDWPVLTMLSEVTWVWMSIAILTLAGVGGVKGYKKHKRKKKR